MTKTPMLAQSHICAFSEKGYSRSFESFYLDRGRVTKRFKMPHKYSMLQMTWRQGLRQVHERCRGGRCLTFVKGFCAKNRKGISNTKGFSLTFFGLTNGEQGTVLQNTKYRYHSMPWNDGYLGVIFELMGAPFGFNAVEFSIHSSVQRVESQAHDAEQGELGL